MERSDSPPKHLGERTLGTNITMNDSTTMEISISMNRQLVSEPHKQGCRLCDLRVVYQNRMPKVCVLIVGFLENGFTKPKLF